MFVGILRAGLGPFLKQAAGLLVARSESTKASPLPLPLLTLFDFFFLKKSFCDPLFAHESHGNTFLGESEACHASQPPMAPQF